MKKESEHPPPEDLSAWATLLYDRKFIYFLAEVTDNKHIQNKSGSSIWENDGLQVAFSFDKEFAGRSVRNSSDYDFGLALTKTGPVLFQYYPGNKAISSIPLSIQRIGNKTIYQAAFPAELFHRTSFSEGLTIGFEWTVNESDSGKYEGSYVWSGGIIGGRCVASEGTVYFEKYVP